MAVQIESSWKEVLENEFGKPYFKELTSFIKVEKEAGKTIYPAGPQFFHAFNSTPFNDVKVVIIGQDPYHNPGQAHGLSFSVPDHVPFPPSLLNIFKELRTDIGMEMPVSGNLEKWSRQGVLLLNASLSVRRNEPGSHGRVWVPFTNEVIRILSDKKEGLVFLLWGRFAQEKETLIDQTKHVILKAAHPSPLSANKGFLGCKHFSKTNQALMQMGKEPIDWKLK